ncbi:hypothetical protein MASR2M15_24230 [Anaerolineales bacterium]
MVDQLSPENLSPEHLMALFRVSEMINSTLNFDEALNNVMDAVMQVTNAQRGFLMIHNEDENTLEVLVAAGIDGDTIEEEGYSTTIVNEVVTTKRSLLTNNAQYDARFQSGQSIIMRGLRAILCAPMLVHSRLIGVVYVDTAMKSSIFRPDDLTLLDAISGLAARAIENARLYKMAVEKGRLENELHMARNIQQGLMPESMPISEVYDIAAHWESAREVAGDFYDAFILPDGRLATVVADVSDKGAAAAMFMAVSRTLVRACAQQGMSPVDTIRKTNDLLLEDSERSGMFVTLYYSVYSDNGESAHINGGHNPPVIYRKDKNNVTLMSKGGRALGWFPDNPVKESIIHMQPGDILVTYTDGLTEAENAQGAYYGEERLALILKNSADRSATEIRDLILRDVLDFEAGHPPFDDLTMIVVKAR